MIHIWVNSSRHPYYGTPGIYSVEQAFTQDKNKAENWKEQFKKYKYLNILEEELEDPCGYCETL